MARETRTGGREATDAVIPGRFALSVGRPPRVPAPGFTWRLLTDLARLESGHTPSRSRADYWDGLIPWIGIRDATGNHGRTILDTEQHVTQEGIDNSSARVLPVGTVCLSRTASVGYVVTMGVPMATSQDFVNWVCGPQLVSRYLHYLLIAEQETIRRVAYGSVHPTLYYPDAKALHVCVPEVGVQRAIAEVLGALDDKIAANTHLATTADALAACTLRSSLTGRSAPLGEIATVTMGSSPAGSSYNEVGVGVPFFQGVRDFGLRSPDERVYTTEPVRMAAHGDTLVSVRAPVGRVNIASTELCIGRGLAAVRSRVATPWTLFHLLRDQPEIWEPYEAEGTVFGSINRDHLTRITLPLVDESASTRLEVELSRIEARLEAAINESQTLAATRDALLPALMSGALRVRDAERMAGEVV